MPAGVAVGADEPVSEHAAPQVTTELLLDVTGDRRFVGVASVSQECLEAIAHHRVEDRPSRTAGTMGSSQGTQGRGPRCGARAARNPWRSVDSLNVPPVP